MTYALVERKADGSRTILMIVDDRELAEAIVRDVKRKRRGFDVVVMEYRERPLAP